MLRGSSRGKWELIYHLLSIIGLTIKKFLLNFVVHTSSLWMCSIESILRSWGWTEITNKASRLNNIFDLCDTSLYSLPSVRKGLGINIFLLWDNFWSSPLFLYSFFLSYIYIIYSKVLSKTNIFFYFIFDLDNSSSSDSTKMNGVKTNDSTKHSFYILLSYFLV